MRELSQREILRKMVAHKIGGVYVPAQNTRYGKSVGHIRTLIGGRCFILVCSRSSSLRISKLLKKA